MDITVNAHKVYIQQFISTPRYASFSIKLLQLLQIGLTVTKPEFIYRVPCLPVCSGPGCTTPQPIRMLNSLTVLAHLASYETFFFDISIVNDTVI